MLGEGGVGRVYDHHTHVPETRAAVSAWADYVEGLIAEEGVAVMR